MEGNDLSESPVFAGRPPLHILPRLAASTDEDRFPARRLRLVVLGRAKKAPSIRKENAMCHRTNRPQTARAADSSIVPSTGSVGQRRGGRPVRRNHLQRLLALQPRSLF